MPLESSFRSIVDTFKSFADSHKQIHSYHFGDIASINTSGTIHYTLMQIEPNGSVVPKAGEVGYGFIARVMDIVKKDKSNLPDVLSDTHQALLDFLAHLKINGQDAVNGTLHYHLKDQPVFPVEFWDEWGDDECAGWQVEFTLWVSWDWNECAIPN